MPSRTQWHPVPGEHGQDVLFITNGQGEYLRRDRGGWSRADSTGAAIDGALPAEVALRQRPGFGSITCIRPVRRYGPPVNMNLTWILED